MLSDHDVVYIEADIWLRKVRQQPRQILRYNKANWDNIKSDLEDTLKRIINTNINIVLIFIYYHIK
jgi:hypothetical protein